MTIKLKYLKVLLAIIFNASSAYCNDTLILKTPVSIITLSNNTSQNAYQISGKYFKMPFGTNAGSLSYFSLPPIDSRYTFENCGFDVYGGETSFPNPILVDGMFDILRSHVRYFPVINASGEIRVFESICNYLTVENSKNLAITLGADSMIKYHAFNNISNLKLQYTKCQFSDSADVRIFNSKLLQFDFLWSNKSGSNFYFSYDTILNFVGAFDDDLSVYQPSYKYKNVFYFDHCYIDGYFLSFQEIPNASIVFNNCTFGPDANLGEMSVKKISFRNCRDFSKQLFFSFSNLIKKPEILFTNTDVSNIRFEFKDNMTLFFDTLHNRDDKLNSYKALLEKFELEGKVNSYRNVDLQYRKFKDSGFWHYLNEKWWNYGYEPDKVFYWTFAFLCLFYGFNIWKWKEMHEAYPIFAEQLNADRIKKRPAKLLSTVFLFTLFIFFSLRINFEKLKIQNQRFVYFFLLQYLVGLWCLVFILRYIFKL